MQLENLDDTILQRNPKAEKNFNSLKSLIGSIKEKELPDHVISEINRYISDINDLKGSDSNMNSQIKKVIKLILKPLIQEFNIVPKNHYQMQWLAIGMAVFGIPMGVAFGMSLGNLALLGIGLPIGMAIGIAVGNSKDKQAKEEGKQLDWVAK